MPEDSSPPKNEKMASLISPQGVGSGRASAPPESLFRLRRVPPAPAVPPSPSTSAPAPTAKGRARVALVVVVLVAAVIIAVTVGFSW